MKATFLQVKAVTDTLPIGFYTTRKIEAVLTEDTESSWYDPLRDTINISYKQLTDGIERITEDKFEMVIRSNHYHEVAHAMLTPKDYPCPSWFNIFEDERIERVTANLFYGINFAEAFNAICGEITIPATSAEHAFFNLVRYHHGAKEWLDEVERLIEKHKTVHRNSGEEYGISWSSRAGDYYHDVEDLWERFRDEWKKDRKSAEGDRDDESTEGKDGKGGSGYKGDIKDTPEDNEGKDTAKGESEREGEEAKSEATSTEDSKAKKRSTSAIVSADEMKAIMSKVADCMMNPEFYQATSILFENFHRKNSKGNGINGYSGVLNPRLADRPDYRMFERSVSSRGSNSFGTFHLTLYIDTSGSFRGNDDATNKILKSLALIEQKNRNFTFDVVTMGNEEKISPKSNRFIASGGGNHLSGEIFEIYRKMQLPQTYNYNIVLFDGDAYSNDVYPKSRVKKWLPNGKGFQAFNNNNCMIITNSENKEYIDRYAPSVKVIYTYRYVDELTDNVMKALQTALI